MSTIANTVYTKETIDLGDGTEVTLKPLPIGRMREFMEAFNKLQEISEDNEAFTIFNEMTLIILKTLDKNNEWTTDKINETVDLETMKYMFRVSGGIDMDAPKEIAETLNPREGVGTV